MQKHIPVLLNEVLTEVDQLVASKDEITIIDCTLGQAGHSEKIFEKIKQGVLISIDLDINSINWVIDSLRDKFEITSNNLTKDDENLIECFKLKDKASTENKTWYILQSDFA